MPASLTPRRHFACFVASLAQPRDLGYTASDGMVLGERSPRRTMTNLFRRTSLAAAAAILVLLSLSADAHAQSILAPSDRPHFFAGGIGPTFYAFTRACGGNRSRYLCRRASFKAGLDYGYHFSGRFEGPAIGVSIEQTFDDNLYTFNPAFKFWWDIEIADKAIYVTPFAKVGYLLGSDWIGGYGFDTDFIHGLNLGAGVEGRTVLHNRALLFLRLIHVDTFLGDFPGDDIFIANWTILIGGGVVWD
jgi:hypothetical protein